jgi:glucosamine--fructose-6-phosphate aminotransferase (isomerizing)
MCGIIGCTARDAPVVGAILDGLKRLEYRGYDSAGIAVLDGTDLTVVREVGKINRLEQVLSNGHAPKGRTGLGHTRWATHGKPSETNAHPHQSPSGDIVAVHNGIIENYRDLRASLIARGHKFRSETDSEVIPHLIEAHYEGDILQAVLGAVRELKGSFAISAMHRAHPGVVIGVRKDSPLIVGLGHGRNFLASDVSAVLEHTKRVIFLEEGDVAMLTAEKVDIVDFGGRKVERPVTEVSWDLTKAEKGGFDHFMLKEIHEQPTVVADNLLGRIDEKDGLVVLDELRLTDAELRALNRITIVACGTSWHAGLVAKFFLERFARIPVEVDYASEFRYRIPILDKNSAVIGISQSGETADTIAAMRLVRSELKCKTIGLCNVVGSTMARESDGLVMTHAGPEIGVASTKAFMGQLVSALLLALKIGQARAAITEDQVRVVVDQVRKLPQLLVRALDSSDEIQALAERFQHARDFLFLGRGICYPIALEGALKLKEISYIHAEGYPAGEMKHGPIALIDEAMPIVVIATRGPVYEKVVGNIEEAHARGGRILALVNPGDDRVCKIADSCIVVPEVESVLSPMVNVVPLQLLAYWMARRRGCDVDQPRNLAKSVTVE